MELSVSLNVGGKMFMTTRETLEAYPETLLGKMATENKGSNAEVLKLSFDRNPKIMNSVLDFYRTGELHLPSGLCAAVVERELKFWGIPKELIDQCCWKKFEHEKSEVEIREEIEVFLDDRFKEKDTVDNSLRSKIWCTLQYTDYSLCAKVGRFLYFTVVMYSVLIFVLQTCPPYREFMSEFTTFLHSRNLTVSLLNLEFDTKYYLTHAVWWMQNSEQTCFAFFTIELFLRFVVCPRKKSFFGKVQNVVDAFLLAHHAIMLYLTTGWEAKFSEMSSAESGALVFFFSLRVLQVCRIFFVVKEFDTMKVLVLSAKGSVKDLLLLVFCVLCFVTLFGAAMFITELLAKTFTFHSIPAAMWWAAVTMTTVGYGDVYPVSSPGQLLGALCALSGVIVLAMPVAVLATRFTDYHGNLSSQKQKKVTLDFLQKNPQFCRKQALHREDKEGWKLEDESHDVAGDREGGDKIYSIFKTPRFETAKVHPY